MNRMREGLNMTRTPDRPDDFALKPVRKVIAAATLVLAGALVFSAQAAPAGHGGAGHSMMGAPRHIDRMLDQVQASDEQRSQVQAIVSATRADLKAQRGAEPDPQVEMAKLFAQPTVDARAVEALRQQMLAQHDQASRRWTQAMLDISRVLTPEQRQLIAERMSQRQAMMQRHRAERDSAPTAPAPSR
jgi:Spy/CpxP family protein refolding chaperone